MRLFWKKRKSVKTHILWIVSWYTENRSFKFVTGDIKSSWQNKKNHETIMVFLFVPYIAKHIYRMNTKRKTGRHCKVIILKGMYSTYNQFIKKKTTYIYIHIHLPMGYNWNMYGEQENVMFKFIDYMKIIYLLILIL